MEPWVPVDDADEFVDDAWELACTEAGFNLESLPPMKEVRSLYRRSHAKQLQDNGQLSLCQAWQRFEREHGSAEDHFQACLKTEPLISKVT